MKYGVLTFLLFKIIFDSCAQQCPSTSVYFSVDSATKMTEHAGYYGGGSSVSYEIFIRVKKRNLKLFDSAWAHGNASVILPQKLHLSCDPATVFKKRRDYKLTVSIDYNNTGNTVLKKPLDCPQELILRYKARGKIRYITISKFTNLQTVNLP